MIRRSKPVQLLEWGQGTNTTNQNWNVFAKGRILSASKPENGVRVLSIEVDGSLNKKNLRDDSVKIAQEGQGMTPTPGKWGEVAFGRLKNVDNKVVEIEVKVAIKIGR